MVDNSTIETKGGERVMGDLRDTFTHTAPEGYPDVATGYIAKPVYRQFWSSAEGHVRLVWAHAHDTTRFDVGEQSLSADRLPLLWTVPEIEGWPHLRRGSQLFDTSAEAVEAARSYLASEHERISAAAQALDMLQERLFEEWLDTDLTHEGEVSAS